MTDEQKHFWQATGSVLFLVVGLILLAQYGSKKAALSIMGLIFMGSLLFNIDKIKGVFEG